MMDKETVIGAIAEIANDGEFTGGAIDELQKELGELYSPVEITNILKVAKMVDKEHDKNIFAESMCEVLFDKIHPISHETDIRHYFSICMTTYLLLS